MDDTCTIYRDPEGTTDDVINETTGELQEPVGDELIIYNDGRFKIKPASSSIYDRLTQIGGLTLSRQAYEAAVPISAPEILEGDRLVANSTRRDPTLVGKVFIVREAYLTTFAIQKKLLLELMKRVDVGTP